MCSVLGSVLPIEKVKHLAHRDELAKPRKVDGAAGALRALHLTEKRNSYFFGLLVAWHILSWSEVLLHRTSF